MRFHQVENQSIKNTENIEKDNGNILQDKRNKISPIFSIVFVKASVGQHVYVRQCLHFNSGLILQDRLM